MAAGCCPRGPMVQSDAEWLANKMNTQWADQPIRPATYSVRSSLLYSYTGAGRSGTHRNRLSALGVSVRPLTALQHHRQPGPRPGPGSTLQSHPVLRSRSTRYCLNFRKPAESSTNPRPVEGTSAATGKPVPPMLATLGHPPTGARCHID